MDMYFSVDVETDGPIPGPYSMLSVGIVVAGTRDGNKFHRPADYTSTIYCELKPISDQFEIAAMDVNGLNRNRLLRDGTDPVEAMPRIADWVNKTAGDANPIMVAFPLSFDWTWLYWYFVQFSRKSNPFGHSQCLDIKTAIAIKTNVSVKEASKSKLPSFLRSVRPHTHHALEDAIEQAEIFANVMEWDGLSEYPANDRRIVGR